MLSGPSVASSSVERPLGPAGWAPDRSAHVQSSAHGRLSSTATAAAISVPADIQPAVRHEPPASSSGQRHEQPGDHEQHDRHREECRREGEHERREGPRSSPAPKADRCHAVDEVGGGRQRVGGLEAGAAANQVDQPRQRREPEQGLPVALPDISAGDERRGDIDDHAGDPCPAHREHRRQAPCAQRAEQVQPDHRHRHEQRHPEERHDARDRRRRPAGGQGRGGAERSRVEALPVIAQQLPCAVGEREELPDRRDAVADERAAADDDADDHAEPCQQRAERCFPPPTNRAVGADERCRLTAAEVGGEARAAAVLEPEHLAFGDHPLTADLTPAA